MGTELVTKSVAIIFTVIAGVTIVLRSISRFVIVRKVGTDDIFAIISYLAAVALAYAIWAEINSAKPDIPNDTLINATSVSKFTWASVNTYGCSMIFLKLSALIQYLRFLLERPFRITCYIMLTTTLTGGIASFFVDIFSCQPIAYYWDKTIPNGKCIDLGAWLVFAFAWIIVTDVITVGIPIVAIKGLNMPISQKRALIFVFALGGLCIASIFRLHAIYMTVHSSDSRGYLARASMWSTVEVNTGITAISLPPLKVLYVVVRSHLNPVKASQEVTEGFSSAETMVYSRPSFDASPLDFPTIKKDRDPWEIP